MAKLSRTELSLVIVEAMESTVDVYKSHAYAAGWLESMLVSLAVDLPRHKQVELMHAMTALKSNMAARKVA